MRRLERIAYFLLRVTAGFLFLEHGGQKLFGWFGGVGGHPGMTVPLLSRMGLAGTIEFFGGVLVLLGLLTRPAAFVMAGEMAVAYFTVHFKMGFWPIINKGEPAILYCFIFLFFAAHGGGPWSLDALLFRRRARAEVGDALGR